MNIALNTDYLEGTGNPEKYLRMMAEAGFTHVHWCHHWNTDFMYSLNEINEYKKLFKRYGLTMLDIHGSSGQEKCWFSTIEYQRKAGVELVINRMEMLAEMEGEGVLMMHPPYYNEYYDEATKQLIPARIEAQMRSLDELIPYMERYNIKIALENLPADTFEVLPVFQKEYPAEWIGVTFDSGHANMADQKGLKLIWNVKDRIEALHLHDNDGSGGDLHQPPFYGTINWNDIAKLLKESSYSKTGRPLSFELSMRNTPFFDPELKANQPEEKIREYLADACERCKKVVDLYNAL